MAETNSIRMPSGTQLRQRLICAGCAGMTVLLINFWITSTTDFWSYFLHFLQYFANAFSETIEFLTVASWKPWFLGMGSIVLYTLCRWTKGAEVGGRLTLMLISLFLSVILLWCVASHNLDGRSLLVETGFGVLATIAAIRFKINSGGSSKSEEETRNLNDHNEFTSSLFTILSLIICAFATISWYVERDLYPDVSAILTTKYGAELRQMKIESVTSSENYSYITFAEKTVKTEEQPVCFSSEIKFPSRFVGETNRCSVSFVVRNGAIKITGPSILDTVNRGEARNAVLAVAEGFVAEIRKNRKELDDKIAAQNTWQQ